MVKVVGAKILSVKNHIYNAIRSFVESSVKDIYPWNICVKMPSTSEDIETIRCEKESKWVLTIEKSTKMLQIKSSLVMARKPYATVIQAYTDAAQSVLTIDNNTFDIKNPDHPLYAVFIVPEDPEKSPYHRPIAVSEIVSKLRFYQAI